MKTRTLAVIFATTAVFTVALILLMPSASASAAANPTPAAPSSAAAPEVAHAEGGTLGGELGYYYVVGNYTALAIVQVPSWTGSYVPESNGSSVYAAELYISLFDLKSTNSTVALNLWVEGKGFVSNQSVLLQPYTQVNVALQFPSNPNWVNVRLYLGVHGEYWAGRAATPVSLLPVNFLNMGGLDLLGLTILYEGVAVCVLMILTARAVMKWTRWAPKWSMGIVGHVCLGAVAGIVILDYQAIDQTFAGWSPLLYVGGVVPLMYLWSLSLFNKGKRAMILQQVTTESGAGIAYKRWLIRFDILADGMWILLVETWKDSFYRFLKHYVKLGARAEGTAEVFQGPLLKGRSPTRTRGGRRKQPAELPIFGPQEDDIEVVMWLKSGLPLEYTPTRLTIHREVNVPAGVDKHGVAYPAHARLKLTWPHIVDGSAAWGSGLHDIHYRLAALNHAGAAEVEDLIRIHEETEAQLGVLKSHMGAEIERRVARREAALHSADGTITDPLDEDEAETEAQPAGKRRTL